MATTDEYLTLEEIFDDYLRRNQIEKLLIEKSVYLFEYIPTEISIVIMSYMGNIEFVIMAHVCKLWRTIIELFGGHFMPKNQIINHVTKLGYLNIIQWARKNGCGWNYQACALAALGGHLDILRWMRSNGCKWDYSTCSNAALGGHLEILKWARENGCEWDSQTCSNAVLGGHLEILKWARENGCE